jgi:glycogen operon protein
LRDLLSYNQRHNLANGENNRDGHGHNLSFNCGVEGPTADAKVNALRGRLQRALLATTLLAQGTPMLCAGDELGHTQQGNNNPYCQDNITTWIDWAAADEDLIAFTAHVLALRRQWLPLGNHWYSGIVNAAGLHDLAWLNHDGSPLQGHDWQDPNCQVMGCLIGEPGLSPEPLLLLINAEHLDHLFTLPNIPNMPNITKVNWQAQLDTTHPRGETQWSSLGEHAYPLAAHSLVLLQAI